MLTDENLAKFTQETGIVNAYDYELTTDQFNSLTPFARNVYTMIRDKENIDFSRGMLMFGGQPIRFATNGGFSTQHFLWTYNRVGYESSMIAFRQEVTPAQLISGGAGHFSHGDYKGTSFVTWESLIAQAREQGFYKNN
jgi:hypothetical protein